MLAFRPHYFFLLVVLLSVVGRSSACDDLKSLRFDKEIVRFVVTLKAIYGDLEELRDIKKKEEKPINTVLDVAKKGYCQLVTLTFSVHQILSLGTLANILIHPKHIIGAFTNLDKTYKDFNTKDPETAVEDAESFAKGMIDSFKGIKKFTDHLSKAKRKKHHHDEAPVEAPVEPVEAPVEPVEAPVDSE